MARQVNKTPVVIVDDHESVRQGLKSLIDAQPDLAVVGEAETGAGALRCMGVTPRAVLILDLDLPDISGVEVLRRVLRMSPGLRVLVFSSCPADSFAAPMLQAGAAGYVSKSASAAAILEALRRVALEIRGAVSRPEGPLH